MTFFQVCLCVFPLLIRTPATGFRAHSNPVWSHLIGLYLQRPYFQISSCSVALVDVYFWETLFNTVDRINITDFPFCLRIQHGLVCAMLCYAKSLQSCPTLCDPTDGSPPGSPIPEILQARTLEWVAISFSNALKWKVKVKLLSCVRLLETPWTAAYQAPPSMGFSRQEYWNGLHCLLRWLGVASPILVVSVGWPLPGELLLRQLWDGRLRRPLCMFFLGTFTYWPASASTFPCDDSEIYLSSLTTLQMSDFQ